MPRKYSIPQTVSKVAAAVKGASSVIGASKYLFDKLYYKRNRSNLPPMTPGGKTTLAQKPKRRPYRKRNMPVKKTVKDISRKVRQLEKKVVAGVSTHIDRIRSSGWQACNQKQQGYGVYVANSASLIEAALGRLYYWDITTNAYVNKSGVTGTDDKYFLFKSCCGKILIRNNYQLPCKVTVYRCAAKHAGTTNPAAAWGDGTTDNPSGAISVTNALSYPTDSEYFRQFWKIDARKRVELQPGQEISDSFMTKSFRYYPGVYDESGDTYDPKYRSMVYLVIVEGVLGHDTVADQRSTLQGAIDVIYDTKYVIEYQGNQSFTNYSCIDNSVAPTTSGVASNMPIADNQTYSVV